MSGADDLRTAWYCPACVSVPQPYLFDGDGTDDGEPHAGLRCRCMFHEPENWFAAPLALPDRDPVRRLAILDAMGLDVVVKPIPWSEAQDPKVRSSFVVRPRGEATDGDLV